MPIQVRKGQVKKRQAPSAMGDALAGSIAQRKPKQPGAIKFAPGVTPPGLHRDAGGESKRVLLPGKKYGAQGQVVQDTHGGRVAKRSGDLTNRVDAYADYKKKPKKPMVMRYLSGGIG